MIRIILLLLTLCSLGTGPLFSVAPSWYPPLDPSVTTGTLPGGLSYFILPNGKPEKRIQIRLVVKVGSLDETPQEAGWAHLLEHMAFRGGKNFPGNTLVKWMEEAGMKLGPGVNARTGFDSTVYQLELPSDRPEMFPRALEVLEDWMGGLILTDDLEEEKLIIKEEWRQRTQGWSNLRSRQLFQKEWEGTPYPDHDPIGTMEAVASATSDSLSAWFRKHYQPQLMGLVVVGDVDVKAVETLIRQKFSREKKTQPSDPQRPRRSSASLPSRLDFSHPEQTDNWIHGVSWEIWSPGSLEEYLRENALGNVVSSILSERLREETKKEGSPLLYTSLGFSVDLQDQTKSLRFIVSHKPGQGASASEVFLREVARLQSRGISRSELEREKRNQVNFYRDQIRRIPDMTSGFLAETLVSVFLGRTFLDPWEAGFQKAITRIESLTLEEINRWAHSRINLENSLLQVTAVTGQGLLSQEKWKALGTEAWNRSYTAPVEWNTGVLTLTPPIPGQIVTEELREDLGFTLWHLSNGARMVLKPTDFQKGRVSLAAVSPGGVSTLPKALWDTALAGNTLLSNMGSGGLEDRQFLWFQKEHQLSISSYLSWDDVYVSGSSVKEELPALFEALHSQFTAQRLDFSIAEANRSRAVAGLEDRKKDPRNLFRDQVDAVLQGGDPYWAPWTAERWKAVDPAASLKIKQSFLQDAGNFTFILVGDFKPEDLKPLVIQWIAGLPDSGRRLKEEDLGVRPLPLPQSLRYEKGSFPKARVELFFPSFGPLIPAQSTALAAAGEVLALRLREVLREESGGTYNVSVEAGYRSRGSHLRMWTIRFDCDPQKADQLITLLQKEILKFVREPLKPVDVDTVRETRRRNMEKLLKENGFWSEQMWLYLTWWHDMEGLTGFMDRIQRINPEALQLIIQETLDPDRGLTAVHLPDAGTASQ